VTEADGRRYEPVALTIDRKAVDRFARALGADPAGGVPPTFAAVYALAATVPQLYGDEEIGIDVSRLVHGEQEFEWTRHPEPGERLVATGRVSEDVRRRGMRFVSYETVVDDAEGRRVCVSKMLNVIRG
jgi:hypothetical protein